MSEEFSQRELVSVFDLPRSTYTSYRKRQSQINPERDRLRKRVEEIHTVSRESAGSRTITGMLNQSGESIGRYKVSRLMVETELVSKQPGPN